MFKKILKSKKGFTLVELLAVVVILGIIAGIAVPSIGGIIENSKKDATVANARQMVAATRLAVASENFNFGTNDEIYIPLGYLVENGYMEPIVDPADNSSTYSETDVTVTGSAPSTSYVRVEKDGTGTYTYYVFVKGSKYNIPVTQDRYLEREVVSQ